MRVLFTVVDFFAIVVLVDDVLKYIALLVDVALFVDVALDLTDVSLTERLKLRRRLLSWRCLSYMCLLRFRTCISKLIV